MKLVHFRAIDIKRTLGQMVVEDKYLLFMYRPFNLVVLLSCVIHLRHRS